MNQKDKTEFTQLISEALNDVLVPALEDVEGRINKKIDVLQGDVVILKEDVGELKMSVDSLSRKFDSQQDRLDGHEVRISTLEKTFVAD